MAKLYRTDGTSQTIEPANGNDFSLAEVQKLVDGYFELVSLGGGQVMLVNEEGLLRELPQNREATRLAKRLIVGDVLVCSTKQFL